MRDFTTPFYEDYSANDPVSSGSETIRIHVISQRPYLKMIIASALREAKYEVRSTGFHGNDINYTFTKSTLVILDGHDQGQALGTASQISASTASQMPILVIMPKDAPDTLSRPILGLAMADLIFEPFDSEVLRLKVERILHWQRGNKEHTRTTERNIALENFNSDLCEFASITAHDLQEPLRGMICYLQLLQTRVAGLLDEDSSNHLKRVISYAENMRAIVLSSMELSRITSGKPCKRPYHIGDIIQEAMKMLEPIIVQSGAQIRIDAMPTVAVDRIQILRIFQNLLSNALKFTQNKVPDIVIGSLDAGDTWVFSVSDNGIGIPCDQKERIFQIFQRAHESQTVGHGIGLAVCKRIVDYHHGKIWVSSEPGQGSTFSFSIKKELREFRAAPLDMEFDPH